MIDLSGKSALVTGGASGIGLGIALALSSAGARVIVNDIDRDAAEAAVARVGNQAFAAPADVSDVEDVNRMVAAVEKIVPIDLLINNAGIAQPLVPIDRLPEAEWQRIMDVNVRGAYLVSRAVSRGMKSRRSGAIVNIASIAGVVGFPASHAYGVSKAAVIMLTQTLACELARYGMRVNAIAPGVIAAPMLERMTGGDRLAEVLARVPLGRLGTPDEIGGAVAFLCSDIAAYITGITLPVDGGWVAFGGTGPASLQPEDRREK